MMETCDRIWISARLATFDSEVSSPYGALEDHAIGVRDGKIAAISSMADCPKDFGAAEVIDVRRAWITPGLIDCHTHLVYGGNRSRESEQRRSGVSYEEIARDPAAPITSVQTT
ncbi:MAG: hypothetical protein JW719_07580 [Pirellulales bacterium]|nr:hypothetical protein [Pirellulales bacterium]